MTINAIMTPQQQVNQPTLQSLPEEEVLHGSVMPHLNMKDRAALLRALHPHMVALTIVHKRQGCEECLLYALGVHSVGSSSLRMHVHKPVEAYAVWMDGPVGPVRRCVRTLCLGVLSNGIPPWTEERQHSIACAHKQLPEVFAILQGLKARIQKCLQRTLHLEIERTIIEARMIGFMPLDSWRVLQRWWFI